MIDFRKYTPNDNYENIVTAHKESVVECIPIKPKAKCRISWESIAVREKQDNGKRASLLKKRNPTNANAQKEQIDISKKNKKNI